MLFRSLSQGAFAATSFADLLKQEKASGIFIPEIEVQTVTTEFLDEEKEEWFGDNYSENVGTPTTWTYDEDKTHAWRLEQKFCYNTLTEHFKNILSDNVYQNAPGDKCKQTRVVIYVDAEYIYKYWHEEYSAAQCYANPPEDVLKYTCEEVTKSVSYEDGVIIGKKYKETDTCYNE